MPGIPQFITFINVMRPARDAVPWTTRLLARGRARALEHALRDLATPVEGRCACMVFRELTPITSDDVQAWLSTHGIGQTELERRELADRVFVGTRAKSMVEVEDALHRIHRAYVANA
jgi:hypothetical protein